MCEGMRWPGGRRWIKPCSAATLERAGPGRWLMCHLLCTPRRVFTMLRHPRTRAASAFHFFTNYTRPGATEEEICAEVDRYVHTHGFSSRGSLVSGAGAAGVGGLRCSPGGERCRHARLLLLGAGSECAKQERVGGEWLNQLPGDLGSEPLPTRHLICTCIICFHSTFARCLELQAKIIAGVPADIWKPQRFLTKAPPSDAQVQEACRRLGLFAFVGISDHWRASVCLFHAMYGGQIHEVEYHNVRWVLHFCDKAFILGECVSMGTCPHLIAQRC